ncbi:macrolide 2'-phosphotransferase [Alkalihalobacillus pseudalcaliphilus]|uniref:macrolide 2'-phosphotransferase n=1 Tax=Alkalihalobacillus pseudalcaliphilus TaxID=79884 RepID=UPI00064D8FE1|nr:macrolide 2'-phosphotransferase [Alkalihalobacillus pseudalcaliphilus]KMK75279.1 macrolide 2'-phosphotransferase [Alkalihalobacillus pseudalcaliphilus]
MKKNNGNTGNEIMEITKKNGIELDAASIRVNQSGLDFLVAIAESVTGNKWLLRMPRRTEVFTRTAAEKDTLAYIAKFVPFEVPIWEVYTPELIAYRPLAGVPAATIDMEQKAYVYEIDEKNLPEIYHQSLAECLVHLHHLPVEGEALPELTKRQTAEQIRQTMKERIEKVKQDYKVNPDLLNRWQQWLNTDEYWPKVTGMIHGDGHVGHMMINEAGEITGMIDWTEAQIADISKDFIPHYLVFGEEALDKLLHYYEKAGGYTWPKMKEHIIELYSTYPIDVAEFAEASGEEEYREMARQGLE